MRDFTDTANPKGWFLLESEGQPKPDYVQGQFPDADSLAKLASTSFACTTSRKFPVHTKKATWLSAAFVYGEPNVPAYVVENIKKAADVHGISDDITPLLKPCQEQHKKAADNFAISDKEIMLYPVGTRFDVENSGYGLLDDMRRKRIPVKEARQAALVLVKRAKETGARLPDKVSALGQQTFTPDANLLKQAKWRSKLVNGADEGLYEQAVQVWAESARDEETKQACAQTWADVDAMLDVRPSAYTPEVEAVWFQGVPEETMRKAAQAFLFIDGDTYPAGMLTSVPKADVESWFAGDMAKKAANIRDLADADTLAASDAIEALSADERQHFSSMLARYHAR